MGYYGFSVDANSRFKMGPGPEGQSSSGIIAGDEFKNLDAILSQFLSTPASHAEICESRSMEEGIFSSDAEDNVVLTRLTGEETVIRVKENDYCFQAATADAAKTLHKAIRALSEKYYSIPFPDACSDLVTALEALYPEYQSCTTDTDCVYATTTYDAIIPGSIQFVATDNCSKIKPMVTGNIGALFNGQEKLLTALDRAREACGERIIRMDCTDVTGFQSNDAPPVCGQGFCRVNPSINMLF